ncbi:STAS domain-containing protein [Microbispora bryophytorum]|uniref:STAS domain-containing protein n=1 Tax=Microbispora bryophytorum TaxID=1460882 RepID=UPI0033DBD504
MRATVRRQRITACADPQGFCIEGDLDRISLPALTLALASMSNSADIHVDLSGLVFIDVGGLRALVTAAALLEGDHSLILRSAPPQTRRLLDLTGWCSAPGLTLGG